jgi:hypothetical protein
MINTITPTAASVFRDDRHQLPTLCLLGRAVGIESKADAAVALSCA